MLNRLKNETSPYLLQHSENPVDWYPWGPEAFDKAKSEDKPVFLSIGYSTCHWCHVMAHESFEDENTAKILNDYFVPIKVDREERPDIDSVYMSVCQAFTGNGGWPMSIFMTWDKKPFFAGSYFPPQSRYGMPGFPDLLNIIKEQWSGQRAELLKSADNIVNNLKSVDKKFVEEEVSDSLAKKAVSIFEGGFDREWGGFGIAPKFPMPHNLIFLMLYSVKNNKNHVAEMAGKTLIQMRKGGIFDQIGYGFSRYSTDKYYLVPHFEKMLYDNALLIIAFLAAYKVSDNELFLDTAIKTAEFIQREMTDKEGGFFSAQDADSDGVEGKFYTFTSDEIYNILGEDRGRSFAKTFDITKSGNFEGKNIPNLLKSNCVSSDYEHDLQKLREYRLKRTKLHLDDKVLTSWNSMMITALSMLYRVTRNITYLQAAESSQKFLEQKLYCGSRLFTSFRNNKHSECGFFDDYAYYTTALIELYNSTLDRSYLNKAESVCSDSVSLFYDRENGGFYLNEKDNSELFMNPKETYDGAIPSGNSIMAYNLVRLYQLTDKDKYRELAEKQLSFLSASAQKYPAGHSMFLISELLYKNPVKHISIVLKDSGDLDKIRLHLPFLANVAIVPESEKYPLVNNQTTYYVCDGYKCLPPANELK